MHRQWLLGVAVAAGLATAQTQVDLGRQSKDVDFSQAVSTRPLKLGTTLPSNCTVGEMFYLTSALAGANLYGCTGTNTWAAEGSGSGVESTTQLTDLQPVRTSSTVLTIGQGCSVSAPCNVAVNGVTYQFTVPMTVTNSAGAALTARAYISDGSDGQSAGAFVVGNSVASGLTCSGGCVVLNNISAFPASAGVAPEFLWTAIGTNGQWDLVGYTDWRHFQGGSGRIFSTNGNCSVTQSGAGAGLTCSGGSWSALQNPASTTTLNMGPFATSFTWTDPSLGDPNSHYGMQFTDTADANSTLNNNFSTESMFSHNLLFNWGQALFGQGTNAKRTASINTESMTSTGSGQNLMNTYALNCWGMSDCARESTTITYAGGNVAGDQGRGFAVVSRLQQLGSLVRSNLSSGPTRSGCPTAMTLTQSVTANVAAQTVTVSSSTGCQVGDWLVVGWIGPTGSPNWDPIQITGVGTGTITARFTANHANGAGVKAGVVLTVANTFQFGQDRVLVDLSGASYSTGTATASNTNITGTGTSWAASMVGGEAVSPGCFAFTGDDQTYAPFSTGANALRSWWEINSNSVTSSTALSIFSFSITGAGSYNGVGSGTYAIRPCARIVFMSGNTVVLSPNNFAWTNGDSVEQAIVPYPDVQGFNYYLSGYTPGGTYRGFMNIANNGGQQHGSIFTVQNLMAGNSGSGNASAFHAFLADGSGSGSNPMLDYVLDFPFTNLKNGVMRLPQPGNSGGGSNAITWMNSAASVGAITSGLQLCGLGSGCVYGDTFSGHPMTHFTGGGMQVDGLTSTDVFSAYQEDPGTNVSSLLLHGVRFGTFNGGQYTDNSGGSGGFMMEVGENGSAATPHFYLGGNSQNANGAWVLPQAVSTSGSNRASRFLGVSASIWNGSSESPVWAYWQLAPDSNATNSTSHAFLYGPCSSPITSSCAYLSAGLDGLTVTGPTTADYWASTPGGAITSAATIAPAKYISHVTGTTTITTITPPAGCSGKSCMLVLIPDAANVYNTGGNIASALTATVNVPVVAVYDNTTGKWYLR